jgi:hypothetical protein
VGDGDFIIDEATASTRGVSPQGNSTNESYRNFQLLFRELMSVPLPVTFASQEDLFKKVIDDQFSKSMSEIQNLMEFDVALRIGNPTQYKRRETDSYLTYITGNNIVVDPIPFQPYVVGSLPTVGGTTTLVQSQIDNPSAWIALRENVGFSQIPELQYTNGGS